MLHGSTNAHQTYATKYTGQMDHQERAQFDRTSGKFHSKIRYPNQEAGDDKVVRSPLISPALSNRSANLLIGTGSHARPTDYTQ